MKRYHYTSPLLISPKHPVTIALIGCGGSGSLMLNRLARMNHALKALDHPGMHVTVYDADTVSESNIGRQLFFTSDLGQNKAQVSVSRINRAFGFSWEAKPQYYSKSTSKSYNIYISCTDSMESRKDIWHSFLQGEQSIRNHDYTVKQYWLDMGNGHAEGQIILGTIGNIKQPTIGKDSKAEVKAVPHLPTLFELRPKLLKQKHKKEQAPSCSLAIALGKQDLFINDLISNYAANMLWRMFSQHKIEHHGVYVNLQDYSLAPIKI